MISQPEYSIGVVTYHARFEKYFKPLIKKLIDIFPDKEIVCVLNGHPDQNLQWSYLKEATKFLSPYRNLRYIAHTEHQSLSKCWNQLTILSKERNLLILNDDTQVSTLLRSEIEPYIGKQHLLNINRSWSHFLIRKDTITKVGWFDERFLGVGHEDSDYAYRLAMAGIPIDNLSADGIRNFTAENIRPGWENISRTVTNKYSEINHEFFDKKWQNLENSTNQHEFEYVSDFGGGQTPFTPVPNMETPQFYDFSLLNINDLQTTHMPVNRPPSSLYLFLSRLYFKFGRKVLRSMRALKRSI